MAMNPMQRKANNSFLLGILITLLITGIIIGFLILQVAKLNKEIESSEAKKFYAFIVATEIKSGVEITEDMLQRIEISTTGDTSIIYESKQKDKEGKYTDVNMPFPTELKAKVNLNPGTVMTSDLTYEEEELKSDVRSQEYNVITLPSQLSTGDYIDIRLRTPEGRDFIVVSHKEVTIPTILDIETGNCIWIDLSEEETLMMSGAIVETYQMNGAKLYATKYVEPGIQDSAIPTYAPSDAVIAIIERDPNIVQEAKQAILNIINSEKQAKRQGIDYAIGNNEDAQDNVTDKTEEEITSLKEEREAYIDSLVE